MIVLAFSCTRKEGEKEREDDVLVAVGDSALTLNQVLRQIPTGLDSDDSTRMFHRIVDSWVKDLVLMDVASKNITDMDRIDRMVEAYRNDLIINQYIAAMSDRAASSVPEDKIREYYEANKEEMILEQPIIKGAFLKVPDTDPNLDKLRRWMADFSDEAIDDIEKSGLRQASQYEYFKNQWHEWNVVAEQIPYRFFDADAFVSSTKNFETEEGGSVYLLHISEYIPSGKEMPYEFAKLRIAEILRADNIRSYTERLVSDIYRKSIREGHLKPGLYDPVKGEMRDSVPTGKSKPKN